MDADLFAVVKLLKSIVMEFAGGRDGALSFFSQPHNSSAISAIINEKDEVFFIVNDLNITI
jgi:hypothetical protein